MNSFSLRAEALNLYRTGIFLPFAAVLLCFSMAFVVVAREVRAETLSIAVPDFSKDINFLNSQQPVAYLVRKNIFTTLTRATSSTGFELFASDRLVVSDDQKVWSFRLKQDSIMHSHIALSAEDVAYSIQRCSSQSSNQAIKKVSARIERIDQLELERQWIDIEVDSNKDQLNSFQVLLNDCPILEKESSVIFADMLGQSGNFVGSGEFRINHLNPGHELSLVWSEQHINSTKRVDQIELHGFPDDKQALTALRLGTVSVLFVSDPQVLESAKKDETLHYHHCARFDIISRRDVSFECAPDLRFSSVRFVM